MSVEDSQNRQLNSRTRSQFHDLLYGELISRVHVLVEMVGTTEDGDHAIVKWKRINPSRDGRNETRTKFPRMKINGVPRRLTRLRVGPPPESLAEPYQAKKQAWKEGLYDDVLQSFEDDETESGVDSPKEIVADIRDRDVVDEYIEANGDQRYVNTSRIAYDYEVGEGTAKKVKQGLKETEGLDDVL